MLALAAGFCAGCQKRGTEAVTADQATQIANAYLTENHPQVSLQNLRVEKADMEDRWRLSYEYPEGGTGGPIIVVVNKKTGEVVHSETQQ